MRSTENARTTDGNTHVADCDAATAVTRSLLGYGVVAGPFYLLVGLAQAVVRDGFDLGRHPLSVLANGPGGWVQTANFALTGAMVVAAGVGFVRALRPRSGAAGWILAVYGLCMVAAAVFTADPIDGFPVGTPEGYPAAISTKGLLHFVAGGIGFLALAVSCVVLAVALSRRGAGSMARLSFVCGVVVFAGFFGPMIVPGLAGPTAGIWLAVVVGFAWLAVMSVYLYRSAV